MFEACLCAKGSFWSRLRISTLGNDRGRRPGALNGYPLLGCIGLAAVLWLRLRELVGTVFGWRRGRRAACADSGWDAAGAVGTPTRDRARARVTDLWANGTRAIGDPQCAQQSTTRTRGAPRAIHRILATSSTTPTRSPELTSLAAPGATSPRWKRTFLKGLARADGATIANLVGRQSIAPSCVNPNGSNSPLPRS
jgi:hypothetical protein